MKNNQMLILFGIPLLIIIALIVWSSTKPIQGERVASQGNRHIRTVDDQHVAYNTTPPTSGPHVGSKSPWGVQGQQIADEVQIHNLEDGGVIIHYNADKVDQETIDKMVSIVDKSPRQLILEPYSPLSTPIVLTAWNKIDYLDTFDKDRINKFINAYRGIDHH